VRSRRKRRCLAISHNSRSAGDQAGTALAVWPDVLSACVIKGACGDSQALRDSTKVPKYSRRCIGGVSVYRAVSARKRKFKRVIDVRRRSANLAVVVGRETRFGAARAVEKTVEGDRQCVL